MSFQKIAFTALILGLIFVNACRIEPNRLLGDLTSFDTALRFSGSGQVDIPSVSFGGSGFTFEMDVYSETNSGCLYSAGTAGSPNYLEVRLQDGMIYFTKGSESIRTFRVFPTRKWTHVAVTLDNKSGEAKAYLDAVIQPFESQFTEKGLTVAARAGKVGFCSAGGQRFTGVVDNFLLFNTAQTEAEIEWADTQFIPFVLSDNVVVYYPFNDIAVGAAGNTVGHGGGASTTSLTAQLVGGPVSQLKAETGKDDVLDTFCSHRGVTLAGKSGAEAIPPFMGIANGGCTATVSCQDADETTFVVNQYWQAEGGITQMTVKTSSFHYWRVSAPGLKVEHRTWGGWNVVPRGSDTIEVDKSTYKFTDDAVLIQHPVGFVKITENNGLLAYDFGVNTAQCKLTGLPTRTSWCDHLEIPEFAFDFSTEAVPEMPLGQKTDQPGVLSLDPVLACPPPSQQYRPDLIQPPPPPPPPPPKLPPPPPVDVVVDPCADYKLSKPAEYDTFKKACDALFTANSASWTKCMTDSCITGTTTVDKPDCNSERLKAATVPGYVIDPKCLVPECENACSGNGQCLDKPEGLGKECVCDTGFTGRDCSLPNSYPCFTASSAAGPVPIDPVALATPSGALIKTSALNDATFLSTVMRANAVEDSALIYLVSTVNDADPKIQDYHLFVMNNNGFGGGKGGYTLTVTGVTAAPTVSKFGTADVASNSGVHTFDWSFNGQVGLAFRNVPAQVTLAISAGSGFFNQVLVGSAHGANKAAGLLAVHKVTTNSVQINGGSCTNECENLRSCDLCSANIKCGWCVEADRCMPGDRSGPHYYGQCANWRYSFDNDVSRRLTQEYAFPVSPGYTDVFLTEASSPGNIDLPLELNVAVGAPEKIQWDLVFLNAWSANHKATWSTQLVDFLKEMAEYPNVGVALNKHDPAGFKVIKPISNPRDFYWFGQHVTSTPEDTSSVHNALAGMSQIAADGNQVGWRAGARKILIVTVDKGFTPFDVNTLRASLMSRDIIPVFLATNAVRAQYQAVIDELGFGFVQTLTASSGNIVPATLRAVQLAAGHSATFYEDGATGHLNTDTWNANKGAFSMYGLKDNFLARFPIPVHREQGVDIAKTRLHMPAFGSATIENVKSEKPIATAFPLVSSALENEFQIIELKGRSWKNLFVTTPVIVSYPTRGQLYQVATTTDSNGVQTLTGGDLIDPSSALVVSDPLGRVAYRQTDTGFGEAFDKFSFEVTDGCVASNVVEITINVLNLNDPPVAEMLPPTEDEDKSQVIRLYAHDTDDDAYSAIITMGLHEMLEDGTESFDARVGALYQYNENILMSREEAAKIGELITAPNTQVKDPQNRVVYWPNLHTNSHADFGKTPQLLVKPCFNYKVVETATTELFESDVARIPIDIRPVNDAPFIYEDTDPSYIYPWATPAAGICYKDCHYDEDFGQRYPWDAEYENIFLGGGDIEMEKLDFVITSLECDPNAVLENPIHAQRIEVGTVIELNEPGVLHPALRFRPGPDAHDNNGGFGTHYCKFTYKVRDQQGAESAKEFTVTIHVANQDDPVRLATEDQLVVALEEEPKAFVIDAVDPENRAFTTVIQECKPFADGKTKGTFVACLDANCDQKQTIDCLNIPAGGVRLGTTAKRQTPSGFGYTIIFTSEKINSLTEGLGYQYLKVAFDDGNGVGDSFLVNVNVVSLNEAPFIMKNGEVLLDTVSDTTVGINDVLSPAFTAGDVDLNQGDMTVSIEISPKDGAVTLDDTKLPKKKVELWDLSGSIRFSGKLAEVNQVLESFRFSAASGALESTYKITLTVNDNGFTGQCGSRDQIDTNSLKWDGTLCKKSATHTLNVNFKDSDAITGVTIAAAGVGAIALTSVAAVLAARWFNKKAASGEYAPWDAFEGDEPSVSNPLYESATIGGTSSIYQDASSNYVEMGSGGSYL